MRMKSGLTVLLVALSVFYCSYAGAEDDAGGGISSDIFGKRGGYVHPFFLLQNCIRITFLKLMIILPGTLSLSCRPGFGWPCRGSRNN